MRILKQQLKKSKIATPRYVLKRCRYGYPQVTFAKSSKMRGHDKYEETKEVLPGTFVWLTCPRVKELVSRLEGGDRTNPEEFTAIRLMFEASVIQHSQIKRKQQFLAQNENENGEIKQQEQQEQEMEVVVEEEEEKPSELLAQTHANYEDWLLSTGLLTRDEIAQWATGNKAQTHEERAQYPQVRHSNAGMKSPLSIKCLHSHIGPYMAGVNDLVGKETFERATKLVHRTEGDIEDLDAALDCRSNCVMCKKFDPEAQK